MSEGANQAVFLSYASQDAAAAQRICDALRAAGVEVWFDQSELVGGDAWDQKIRRHIKDCALLIPIISAATQARTEGYFRLEWRLADQRTHLMAKGRAFLLPVVIDATKDSEAHVPDSFTEVQWTRLPGGETPAKFVERVRKLLAGETMEPGRTRPVMRGEHVAAPTKAKQKPIWLWVGLAVVVGPLAYCVFKPRRSPEELGKLLSQVQTIAADASKASSVVSADKAGASPEGTRLPAQAEANPVLSPVVRGKPAAAGSEVTDTKSVAVLAFANLSDDKENEYFSDGVSEELLTVLQKIPGLHVAARTSAFSFKGKNATAQEIGQKLGVAHLVEGSVQKSGSRVKITARLSRVATGEELWSRSFTRELKDVFSLQEELALAIVGELRGQLVGTQDAAAQIKAATRGGTTHAEAYQLYLQGRYSANRHSEKTADEAIGFFQRAVELDPDFALAWAGLARAHVWMCLFSSTIGRQGFEDHLSASRQASNRALTLEPNLPEGLMARAELQLNVDYDWKAAAETLRAARVQVPADPALLTMSGNFADAMGDTPRAIELHRQAVALDPVNPSARSYLAFDLAASGRFAEALVEYPRVIELNTAAPWAHAGLGLAYLLQGRFEEANVAAQEDAAEWARLLITAMARYGQKRLPESDAALTKLSTLFGGTAAYQVAEVHAYRGEIDQAFTWLDARQQHDGGIIGLQADPLLAKLKVDPRWPAFLRKVGLAEDQLK